MIMQPLFSLKKLTCLLSLAVLAACTLAPAARAQLLAYEGFDYAAGDLVEIAGGELGGGTGWATEEMNPDFDGWYFERASSSLPSGIDVEAAPAGWGYADSQGNHLPTTGGVANNTSGSSVTRQLDLSGVDSSLTKPPVGEFGFDKLGVDNTSFWISFLGLGTEIQSEGSLALGDTHDEQHSGFDRAVALGRPWMLHEDGTQELGPPYGPNRNTAWGILDYQPTVDPVAATGDSYDEKVFFVARVDFTDDGNSFSDEHVTIWTNPDLGTTAPADASAQISDFLVWDFDFNAIRIGGPADTYFDEIRIGLTYGDVAPIAAAVGADFDNDNDVDGNDFLKWQREFGSTLDATDLANWGTEFGTGVGPVAAVNAVPEPSALLLASIFAVTMAGKRHAN